MDILEQLNLYYRPNVSNISKTTQAEFQILNARKLTNAISNVNDGSLCHHESKNLHISYLHHCQSNYLSKILAIELKSQTQRISMEKNKLEFDCPQM